MQTQTESHYLHNDHLGTPQIASDRQGQQSWAMLSQAFGETTVESNASTEINLHLPGQYWDAESGTHYNFHRDYNPATGRCVQSDPIGLSGEINMFAYVEGNPVARIDPDGDFAFALPVIWSVVPPIICALTNCLKPIIESVPKIIDWCMQSQERNCEAFRQSILNTCAGLSGARQRRCVIAADTSYRQCIGGR